MAVGGLLLLGTFVGVDDGFPFGPMRQYSTRADPDGQARSTRVEAVDTTGRVLVVPDTATGLRRAEIEGQADRFRTDPSLLAQVSPRARPAAPFRAGLPDGASHRCADPAARLSAGR